jgi:hypothetical protein
MLEPLESRIAPATFVNAHIVTYTDIDGDHVTVTSSLPIFTSGANGNVNTIFHFSTGAVDGSNTTPQQLQTINLHALGAKQVGGDNISITVQKVSGGDGYANVGLIESSYGLGHVTVQGDLGAIDAGVLGPVSGNSVGLASLTVHSLGVNGTGTQQAGGSLLSAIYGSVGSITVQQDMLNAQIEVTSNTTAVKSNGNIGSVFIGGSLTGGASSYSGNITTDGNVGSVFIGSNMAGGAGTDSGALRIGGKLGSLTVDGSIIGYHDSTGNTTGGGGGSASVTTGNNFPAQGGIGSVTVKGSVMGGDGTGSAEFTNSTINTAGNIGSVTIGKNLVGGAGNNSGEFLNTGGSVGPVKIGGALTGGSGQDSGEINGITLGAISIGGGITGSTGINSGLISSENGIGAITITGGITGGTAAHSGAILAGIAPTAIGSETISSIIIHGDIKSNAASGSLTTQMPGQINSADSIGSLTIYGSLIGGAGDDSAAIIDSEAIGHVTLLPNGGSDAGSILGGAGSASGEISALSLGTVSIAGQISGSTGANSAIVTASQSIGSVSIGGIIGAAGNGSGQISAGTTIGSVHVTGAIVGGAGTSAGSIFATDSVGSIVAGSLTYGTGAGEISVGGNLTSLSFTGAASGPAVGGLVDVTGYVGAISVKGDVAGTVANTGLFEIGGAINSFSITGALKGGAGSDSGSIFAGLDNTSRIGSISITGGIVGGSGAGSGELFSGGGINAATVGDIIGGTNQSSGSIVSNGSIGSVVVNAVVTNMTHGLVGNSGAGSGVIFAGSTIGSVTVHGSILGNSGVGSGAIVSNSIYTPSGDIQGNIGSIVVTGSVMGGAGTNSGQISAAGNLTNVSITGSVTGYSFASNAASGTGAILAGVQLTGTTGGNITTLKIGGALTGGNITAGAGKVTGDGYIEAGHIGSAVIGSIQAGSVGTAGAVYGDGAILAANDIASLTVTGAVQGTSSNAVTISAYGQVTPGKLDLAFGKISVVGSVSDTNFLAGYPQSGDPKNGNGNGAASIGSVVVGGDWSGSNLVAGVIAAALNGNFGDAHATLISSSSTVVPTIASIIIKGNVTGSGAHDTYGFVAKQIDAFSVDGKAQSLAVGVIDPVGQSSDTVVREVT